MCDTSKCETSCLVTRLRVSTVIARPGGNGGKGDWQPLANTGAWAPTKFSLCTPPPPPLPTPDTVASTLCRQYQGSSMASCRFVRPFQFPRGWGKKKMGERGWSCRVDPEFEIGGCPKCACKSAKVFFFQCHTHFQVHNQVWAPWNCDTIITIGINKHEVVQVKITILRLFVATAVNIKAFARTRRLFSPYP